jgi:hypothetical protein
MENDILFILNALSILDIHESSSHIEKIFCELDVDGMSTVILGIELYNAFF